MWLTLQTWMGRNRVTQLVIHTGGRSIPVKRVNGSITANDNAVGNIEFAWDGRKARSNLNKHGVSFEEAQTVFFDETA